MAEPPPTQQFALARPEVTPQARKSATGRREREREREQQAGGSDGQEVLEGLLATSAMLTVQRGGAGARYLVNADRTMVGRHPGADIFLDDATVSRRHALFERRGTEYWVHDQGSLNGTYVNGERIETVRLVSGDQLQIGKFPMTFQQATAAGAEGSPADPQAGPGDGSTGAGRRRVDAAEQDRHEGDGRPRTGWWRSVTARLRGRQEPRR